MHNASIACRVPLVAPLAGSVDRNWHMSSASRLPIAVAPLAGSVDRNMYSGFKVPKERSVAPLAGSVDRNLHVAGRKIYKSESLPSRGAWIEITKPSLSEPAGFCRSPHGERG